MNSCHSLTHFVKWVNGSSHNLNYFTYRVLRKVPVGQVLRHATDVSNVHVTLDRDVLVLAVKTPVKTTAFIMRDGDELAFLFMQSISQVCIRYALQRLQV